MGAHYPPHAMTRKRAEASLALLLAGCTDEMLAVHTVEGLCAGYNVPAAKVSTMLAKAREARRL